MRDISQPIPEGKEYNPLLKFPRNAPCPCESGRKHKYCCLPKLKKFVTHEQAEVARIAMANHVIKEEPLEDNIETTTEKKL